MNTPSRYINYLHVPILIGILWFGLPDKVPAQDFFFEPVTSVGGYGELHLNSVQNSATGDWNKTLDFHRFILFVSHAWSEQWSFKSEIEIEHNYIQDGQGEVALEQAYVQYRSLANWTIQAGVVLPTVGWINTGHEPPLFYSVERPAYAKSIIPTTWYGNGLAVGWSWKSISLRLAVLEDLDGDKISYGIRSARQKGYKSNLETGVWNFSLRYRPNTNLWWGGSVTTNRAPRDTAEAVNTIIAETHGQFRWHAWRLVGETALIKYNHHPQNIDQTRGGYLDLGYHLSGWLPGEFIPWLRLSVMQTGVHADDSSVTDDNNQSILRAGFTWKPVPQIVWKLDWGQTTTGTEGDPIPEINLGVGYMF